MLFMLLNSELNLGTLNFIFFWFFVVRGRREDGECRNLGCACWNYEVMGSQRSYLEGSIDDRDDADDAVDTI